MVFHVTAESLKMANIDSEKGSIKSFFSNNQKKPTDQTHTIVRPMCKLQMYHFSPLRQAYIGRLKTCKEHKRCFPVLKIQCYDFVDLQINGNYTRISTLLVLYTALSAAVPMMHYLLNFRSFIR